MPESHGKGACTEYLIWNSNFKRDYGTRTVTLVKWVKVIPENGVLCLIMGPMVSTQRGRPKGLMLFLATLALSLPVVIDASFSGIFPYVGFLLRRCVSCFYQVTMAPLGNMYVGRRN